MTITVIDIEAEDFLSIKAAHGAVQLLAHQTRILSEYLDYDEGPLVIDNGRKGWESKYDPKYIKGTNTKHPRMTPPDVNTLPKLRWVQPRFPENLVERETFREEMCSWLNERASKYQTCEVIMDRRATTVLLFKKASEALMFKLTWG